jgi:hypothetical protein
MRPRGGIIGASVTPTQSAASGVWTVREAERYTRAFQWPGTITPAGIPNLALWLDASDSTTFYDATSGGALVSAGNAVARWNDKSGNCLNATQGSSGNQPTRTAGVRQGLDGLTFSGTSQFLTIPGSAATFAFLHNGSGAVYWVASFGSSSDPNAQYGVLATGGATAAEYGYLVAFEDRSSAVNNGFISSTIADAGGNRGWLNRLANVLSPQTFTTYAELISASNATAAQRSVVQINAGTSLMANTLTNSPYSGSAAFNLTIGAVPTGGSQNSYMLGTLCEVVIYSAQPTATQHAQLQSYLRSKWRTA